MVIENVGLSIGREDASWQNCLDVSHPRSEADVVLLHLGHRVEPNEASEDHLRMLCLAVAPIPVVIMVEEPSLLELKVAIGAGAKGYILSDSTPETMKQSLHLAVAGEVVLPSTLIDSLLKHYGGRRTGASEIAAEFTPNEQVILGEIAYGKPNKAIAQELSMSEGMVKVHVKSVFRKLKVANRTQAAIRIRDFGLLHPQG